MHRFILGVLAAALLASPAATAQQVDSKSPASCPATFTAKQYHRTVNRIYHQRGRIWPRQLHRLAKMRICAADGATHVKMRRMQRRQSVARHHRLARAARECGSPTCNRRLGMYLALRRYHSIGAFYCSDYVIMRESKWNTRIANSSSGAYGIPQALPGYKMASAGADWRTSARTQIRWFFHYVDGVYGGPCGAQYHWETHNWY